MSAGLKLAIFDVDGTLVDSQGHIHAAMKVAFEDAGRVVPGRAEVLSIVGLSLPEAVARLAPDLDRAPVLDMVAVYKDAYSDIARAGGAAASPLFEGARPALDRLAARDDMLLGVATGKSRRGLSHIVDIHGLHDYFVTRQDADGHPSKPHPAMVETALAEAGCAPQDAVMIGDTTFDIEMGRAAGVRTLAVGWGYHPSARLRAAGADSLIENIDRLAETVLDILEIADE
ncbi:MAG: HAD-IA family hydrolase [Pseudomonadota bacterium]